MGGCLRKDVWLSIWVNTCRRDSCRDVIVFIASFVDITTRRTCVCMHAYSYIGGNFWFGSESHCYRLDV